MFGLTDLYHTGLIVDDIDQACASLGAAFGVEWTQPSHTTAPVRTPGGVVERESIICFSLGNGHHLELIQQVFGGVWVPDDGRPRLHHLAFWVDDLVGESARLEALGMPVVVTGVGEGPVSSFVYHDAGQGSLFLELNMREKRDHLYQMVGHTGGLPG